MWLEVFGQRMCVWGYVGAGVNKRSSAWKACFSYGPSTDFSLSGAGVRLTPAGAPGRPLASPGKRGELGIEALARRSGRLVPGRRVLRVFVPSSHYTCSAGPPPPTVAAAWSLGNPRGAGPGVQGRGQSPHAAAGVGIWDLRPIPTLVLPSPVRRREA